MKGFHDIVLITGIFCPLVLAAQITGNLNASDPRALLITPEREQMLFKKWHGVSFIENRRGVISEWPRHISIEFKASGMFTGSEGQCWENVGGRFLRISQVKTRYNQMAGAFAIYEISDSTLVLAQVLTSTGDFLKEYRFTPYDEHIRNYKPATFSDRTLPEDSLKPGIRKTYHSNGRVASVTKYGVVALKADRESMFLHGFSFSSPRFNPTDTTWLQSVPIGEHFYYHESGQLSSKYYYDDKGAPRGTWYYLFPDGRIYHAERYGAQGRLSYTDNYQYDRSKVLPLIRRETRGTTVYVIGRNDSVQLDHVDTLISTRAGSQINGTWKARNLSSNPVSLKVKSKPTLAVDEVVLSVTPGDSADLIVSMRVPEGAESEILELSTQEWSLDLKIRFIGYHMTYEDFLSGKPMELPRKIFFYRESDAYQLQIAQNGKRVEEKFIPVSKQLNQIELKKGRYQLSLIGPKETKRLEVEVK